MFGTRTNREGDMSNLKHLLDLFNKKQEETSLKKSQQHILDPQRYVEAPCTFPSGPGGGGGSGSSFDDFLNSINYIYGSRQVSQRIAPPTSSIKDPDIPVEDATHLKMKPGSIDNGYDYTIEDFSWESLRRKVE